MIRFKPYFVVIYFVLTACNNVETKTMDGNFFNPKQIIESYLASLKNVGLKKIAVVNKKETISFQSKIKWKNEFNFLDEIDISKAAYRNNLKLDTTISGDTIKLKLVCKEQKLSFKYAVAYYVKAQLVALKIETATKNLIFESKKMIDFIPGKGYSINGFLNLDKHLGNSTSYNIKGIFIPK